MDRLASGYGLLEGPCWDPERGLVFSDVENGGVFLLVHSGRIETLIQHRRGIGGIAFHADGGLVVGGRNISHKGAAGTTVLLDQAAVEGIVGFNDLTTDASGRVYAGSLGASPFGPSPGEPAGYLHVVDLDGATRIVAPGIKLTNGLGFSPDAGRLYHADTLNQMIGFYDVDAAGGLGERQLFARIDDKGSPDGLAVAEDGSVWCALAGAGSVAVFDASGVLRESYAVPHPMPTSVCFGGDGMRDLYVVTGAPRADASGSIFRTSVGVSGLRVPAARVRVAI